MYYLQSRSLRVTIFLSVGNLIKTKKNRSKSILLLTISLLTVIIIITIKKLSEATYPLSQKKKLRANKKMSSPTHKTTEQVYHQLVS